MAQDVGVGLKRSSTINFTMLEKMLMVMGEVDIHLRPSLITPIIQVTLVDHWIFIVMKLKEVYIDLRPANFIHITIGEYTFTTQGFIKKLFQGVCKEKPT